jgi:hypothetical protein
LALEVRLSITNLRRRRKEEEEDRSSNTSNALTKTV